MFIPTALSMPGGGEWVVIFLIVVLLFGANKIPELARGMGKAFREFNKARSEFDNELRNLAEEPPASEKNKLPVISAAAVALNPSTPSAPVGSFTEEGKVKSPHSDFAMDITGKKAGETIYDPNNGRAFRVPEQNG